MLHNYTNKDNKYVVINIDKQKFQQTSFKF